MRPMRGRRSRRGPGIANGVCTRSRSGSIVPREGCMAEPVVKYETGIGFAATAVSLLIALGLFPTEPSPRGALMVPALILSAGILFLPVMRAIKRSPALLNAENLVAFGFVFWLLLDLIQGAYDLRDASDSAIRDA